MSSVTSLGVCALISPIDTLAHYGVAIDFSTLYMCLSLRSWDVNLRGCAGKGRKTQWCKGLW